MECAFCDNKEVSLVKEIKDETFRKESFMIINHYYKCGSCDEIFVTSDIEQINIVQVYNQYREKHKILFPEQVKKLREKYDVSAAKMSEILGFGVNSYGKYERGEIPNESNAALLNLITEPANFKELLDEKREFLSLNEFAKISQKIDFQLQGKNMLTYKNGLLNHVKIPTRFNGFVLPSIEKLGNLIVYFAENVKPFMVKLNKLLFYTDFLNYKSTGYSISGFPYTAISMGPVPENYGIFFQILENEGYIQNEYVPFRNGEGSERFIAKKEFDEALFTEIELENLKKVATKFLDISTDDIKEISHKESAWLNEIDKKNIIDYQKYAFDLKAI
jgi:putative zinc finger/helix-turn-helix YgiT family protein